MKRPYPTSPSDHFLNYYIPEKQPRNHDLSLPESFCTLSVSSPCSSFSMNNNFDAMINEEKYKKSAYDNTLVVIQKNPRHYLGIPEDCLFVIDMIHKYTNLDHRDIMLTFKKIRLGQPFIELGNDFGISLSTASRIFSKSLALMANVFEQMVVWPSSEKIMELLPIPFRARYSSVECIIDCLEIEIEKHSNSIHQSLTWSSHKNTNTLKYLISSTPSGIISFISKGYGGRASDVLIVEQCGILNKLKPGTVVMADRGFKHIENVLMKQNCRRLRPPSVETGVKMNKTQVKETKQIASLRIHIERVIRRLREFKFLKPHSCIHSDLIDQTDSVIIVACGLVNMQGPLIK